MNVYTIFTYFAIYLELLCVTYASFGGEMCVLLEWLTERVVEPVVTADELLQHGRVMGDGLVCHHPPARHHLQPTAAHQPEKQPLGIKGTQHAAQWSYGSKKIKMNEWLKYIPRV